MGVTGVWGVSRVYWRAGRECRYSGAQRDMGTSGGLGFLWGVGAVLGVLGSVGVYGVYLGLTGTLGTQGPKGVWGHQVALEVPSRCRGGLGTSGAARGVGGVRCVLGAGRDSRYSGSRRGIGVSEGVGGS